MTARHILVVDDEVGIRELLSDILQDEGYHVKLAENAAEARHFRQKQRPDLVLLDIWMPDCDGITLLKEWGAGGMLTMPVVMMSGHGTIDTAVEATRIGAFDFLEKPIALQKLLKTVSAGLKHGERLPKSGMSLLGLSKSAVMSELRQRLDQLAHGKAPLLLSGEHGSGAELCARFLHEPGTPWATLTDYHVLVETPTDLLEQNEGGLIFVPEVAALSRTEQRGLHLLINKAEKFGVRVVVATAETLSKRVEEKQFDDILFQLLSAASLRVPALDEHPEDIPELVNAMATMLVEMNLAQYREFDISALNALRNVKWPGNLTQLDSVVRNLLQTSLGEKITQSDVQRVLSQFQPIQPLQTPNQLTNLDRPLREARDDFERLYFEYHLEKAAGNMSKLAETVELERTHLYRKLKQLGIKTKL